MDLLGDLGTADQLTSVRSENAVLQERVKALNFRVKELTIENETLKAELEIYRQEKGAMETTGTSSANHNNTTPEVIVCDDFLRSGNGQYPQKAEISLDNLHGNANLLCCALSADDTILATGGADCHLSLCAWGAADGNPGKVQSVIDSACRVRCEGPVIATSFPSSTSKLVAAGCMDGSAWVVACELKTGQGLVVRAKTKIPQKHAKHVKAVAWSTSGDLLATASADGTCQVHKIEVKVDYATTDDNDDPKTTLDLQTVETFHLQGAVESVVFLKQELCCYAREKPYLLCFDTTNDYAQRKINLNHGGKPPAKGTSMEDQHVSFAVLDMAVSPNGKYLALATDASRNIILEADTGLHVRNLYGHQNDGFSNPRVAWSCNGQYLLGNTQEDGGVCVWDIASSKIVKRMVEHGQTVRDLFSSKTMDTLVTTSFDKATKIWFAAS